MTFGFLSYSSTNMCYVICYSYSHQSDIAKELSVYHSTQRSLRQPTTIPRENIHNVIEFQHVRDCMDPIVN